jgi:hypothetical protein
MSAHESLSFDDLAASAAEKAHYATLQTSETANLSARFSSPWPWALALAISLTMWVGIGWLIWTVV